MNRVFQVLYNPEVYKDIQDVLDYYYQITGDYTLGEKFLEAIKIAERTLKNSPLLYQIRYDNIRFLQILPFSHIVHFRVDESNNLIRIVAILHSSDNPEKWLRP